MQALRRAAVAAAVVVAVGVVAGSSSATLVAKPAGRSLEARAAAQRANVRHARIAVRWLERASRRRQLELGERRELRWSRRAVVRPGWLLVELRKTERALEARRRASTVAAANASWPAAVQLVGRYFGEGLRAWLWSCSAPRSEGGHGRFVMNTQGSGAGGWLQFMPGTFYGVIDRAVLEAARRGLVVPPFARQWNDPLGQAVAGVEMIRQGRRGEWTGYGC